MKDILKCIFGLTHNMTPSLSYKLQTRDGGGEKAGAALGVPKGGRVGKSFQLRPGNPPTWRREMIPPEGQAWSSAGCLSCESAQPASRFAALRSSMNHSFLNVSKCVYKIKLRPRAAPGGAGR